MSETPSKAQPGRLPVALCVSTRNEEARLAACIASVAEWISEIVVVDMESTDRTREIAAEHGARIVEAEPAGWAEPGRQLGIDAVSVPWVLVLDADERGTEGIRELAADVSARDDVHGVRLPRKNITFGRWSRHSGIWPDRQLRLFRADRTTWSPRIHGGPEVDGHVIDAPEQERFAIEHHSFATLSEWIRGTNSYTDLEADRLQQAGRRGSLPRLVGVPVVRFLESYVGRRGALSGMYGLAIALLAACYWILAELKLWERTDSRRRVTPRP